MQLIKHGIQGNFCMGRRIGAGVAALLMATVLGGCAMTGGNGPSGNMPAGTDGKAALSAVDWELVSWSGHEVPYGELGEPVILHFQDGPQASVSGRAWCNRFSAPYVLRDAARLTIGHAAATRMACAERAMQFEAAFLDQLQALEHFSIHGNTLELRAADGELMILQARALPGQ